ncbi:MAG: hypothetical protein L7H18_04110 [Candidatus Nealsonbacteria bacterium DGGOD1a]|jgi:hypothetical protein|nr:MAG: hypothetical protein L7H18_04110 [Candidatus Nealsonbacteria bacterium DGGOD1a]
MDTDEIRRQKGIRQKNLRFSVLDPLSAKKITGRPAIQWAVETLNNGVYVALYGAVVSWDKFNQ